MRPLIGALLVALIAACGNGPTENDGHGPTILFDMEVEGNRDIYSATLSGDTVVRVTADLGVDVAPSSAADILVFTSYRDGNAELYRWNAVDDQERLTTTSAHETEPRLSPDGARLVFTRDDGVAPRSWISSVTGASAAPLTTATGATIEGNAAWKASGDSLTLMSNGTQQGKPFLFVSGRIPPSTPLQLAKPVTSDSAFVEPTWSHDGKTIAFTAGATGGPSRIAVLTRATGTVVLLTPPTISAGQPVYLPDGRIVFTVFLGSGATSLAWIDPASPETVHAIPLSGTNPQHPAIIWP